MNPIKKSLIKWNKSGGLAFAHSIVGFIASYEDFVLPWCIKFCDENKIQIEEGDCVFSIFQKIKLIKSSHKQLLIYEPDSIVGKPDDVAIIGIPLSEMDERFSLIRIKTDVRNECERIGMLRREDDPDIITIYPEIFLIDSRGWESTSLEGVSNGEAGNSSGTDRKENKGTKSEIISTEDN